MKFYRPSTSNNAHHKMNFQVVGSKGKSKIDRRVYHEAIQDSTGLKDSQIVPSKMLKKASPYCSSVVEAYTGKCQKVRDVDRECKRRRVESAIFHRKVDAVAYPGDSMGEKCTQNSFYNRLSGRDDLDRVKVNTAVTDCNLAGSSEQNDFDTDACSVGSCSVNSIRADKFSNYSVAVPCLARDLLSSDAESYNCSFDEEEDGSHCLEEKVEGRTQGSMRPLPSCLQSFEDTGRVPHATDPGMDFYWISARVKGETIECQEISSPTPTSCTNLAFIGWSRCIGTAMIGTPNLMPSITELQPQWLTNPPIFECLKILPCGAQPSSTIALSPILSRNPCGNASSTLIFSPTGNLITHMKLTLLISNPRAICSISSLDKKYSLPNEANTVEPRSFLLSHSMIFAGSSSIAGA